MGRDETLLAKVRIRVPAGSLIRNFGRSFLHNHSRPMNKIFIRSVFIALILTGAIAFIVWWMSMRRVVPEHARVIPQDAFAVVTLNLREISIDHSSDEHLYPEM